MVRNVRGTTYFVNNSLMSEIMGIGQADGSLSFVAGYVALGSSFPGNWVGANGNNCSGWSSISSGDFADVGAAQASNTWSSTLLGQFGLYSSSVQPCQMSGLIACVQQAATP